MNFTIEKVDFLDKDILYRLLQYSLFEESEYDFNEMNDEAIYEYRWFDKYFEEDDRDAYFIKELETKKLLGFLMVNTNMQKFTNGHSIAEFMVIPKYRRNKIGKKVAHQIFEKYKGNWEVQPSYGSEKAFLFWKKTIDEYTKSNYQLEDGIFLFRNY